MSRIQADYRDNRLSKIVFTGSGRKLTLNNWVQSGAQLQLANDQVNQLTLTLSDDTLMSLYRNGNLKKGTTVTYAGRLRFEVRGYQVTPDDGGISLTLRSKSNAKLKDQTGAKNWGKQSTTAWLKRRFKEAGLKPIVQPGLPKRTFTRSKKTSGSDAQSTWDVMTDLRDKYGLWVFEAGQYGIAARPEWITKNWPKGVNKWQFWWNSAFSYHAALVGSPAYEYTADSSPHETVTFKWLSNEAEQCKPGDIVRFTGKYPALISKLWIVTQVTVPLTSTGPVEVTCIRPTGGATVKSDTRKKKKTSKKKKRTTKRTKAALLKARKKKLAAKRAKSAKAKKK